MIFHTFMAFMSVRISQMNAATTNHPQVSVASHNKSLHLHSWYKTLLHIRTQDPGWWSFTILYLHISEHTVPSVSASGSGRLRISCGTFTASAWKSCIICHFSRLLFTLPFPPNWIGAGKCRQRGSSMCINFSSTFYYIQCIFTYNSLFNFYKPFKKTK